MEKNKISQSKISTQIGAKLRCLRVEMGYSSYEQFAFEHQLSRIQYFKMESGTNFTMASLLKLLEIHEMDFFEFIADVSRG